MEEMETKKGLKVYSWELLRNGLILTGGFIFGLFRLDGWFEWITLLMLLYTVVQYFRAALTREGFEKYQRESEIQKASARARLGRFAFMDGMAPFVLLALGFVTVLILPENLKWMALIFLFALFVLMLKGIGDGIEKMDEETRLEKEEKAGKKTEETMLD